MTPSFFTSNAHVAFSAARINAPAGGSFKFAATIYPATGPTTGMYGGYIVLTPRFDRGVALAYRIPFAGFVGDYQSIVAMTPTVNEFPWLATPSGSSYVGLPSGGTFTMSGGDVPYILVHFDHHVRRMIMDVFNADTGASQHRAYDISFLPRNSTSTGFFAYPWDGHTWSPLREFIARDGRYTIRLKLLKAGGDPSNPAHWEKWVSPVITIARGTT